MAWLTGWKYRKAITVTNNESTTLTNYQVKVLVGESSGASGFDLSCHGRCLSTFLDVVFTSSDGSTQIDFWREGLTGSTPNQLGTFWVEVPSISGSSTATIYMYYGKSGATDSSNGANTFPFFDHFDGDLSKWTGDTGSASISSSKVSIVGTGSAWKRIFGNVAAPATTAIRFNAAIAAANYMSLGLLSTDANDYAFILSLDGACIASSQGGSGNTLSSNWTRGSSFKTYDILVRANTNTRYFESGTELTNSPKTAFPVNSTSTKAAISNYSTTASNIQCDWILIRAYTLNEPSIACAAEEAASTEVIGSAWGYRKRIVIAHPATALSDYQLTLKVGESSGSSGADIHCVGRVASDFDDLRFTASDGVTKLSYWIEEISSGTTPNQTIKVWVKIPTIYAHPEDTAIYMYYSGTQTADSSGSDTFVLFDDFDDSSLSSTKWDSYGSVSESGTAVSITGNTSYVASKNTYAGGYALRCKAKSNTSGTIGAVCFDKLQNSAGAVVDFTASFWCSTDGFYYGGGDGTNNQYAKWANPAMDTSYHVCEGRRTGSADTYVIDTYSPASGSYPTNLSRYVAIKSFTVGYSISVDWIALRKFVATEPSWGSWGSEETLSTTTEKSQADTGSGTDAIIRDKEFTLTDTGSGSDAISLEKNFLITDNNSLTETLTISVDFTYGDTGSGTDALLVEKGFTDSDSGTGTDAISIFIAEGIVNLSDSGQSEEIVADIQATLPTIGDSGSSAESFLGSEYDKGTQADSGSGSDSIVVGIALTIADAGAGTESTPTLATGIILGETGSGSDSIQIEVTITMGETCTSQEIVTGGNVTLSLSDYGNGVDGVLFGNSLSVADNAYGTDAVGKGQLRLLTMTSEIYQMLKIESSVIIGGGDQDGY